MKITEKRLLGLNTVTVEFSEDESSQFSNTQHHESSVDGDGWFVFNKDTGLLLEYHCEEMEAFVSEDKDGNETIEFPLDWEEFIDYCRTQANVPLTEIPIE